MRGRDLVNYRTQGFRDKKSRLSSRKVSCYTCCILCIPSIPFVSALCWELTQTLRGGWSWFVGSMLRYKWKWGHWKEALCRCHAMAEPSLWPCPLERIPLTNHSFTVPGWEPGCGAHTWVCKTDPCLLIWWFSIILLLLAFSLNLPLSP